MSTFLQPQLLLFPRIISATSAIIGLLLGGQGSFRLETCQRRHALSGRRLSDVMSQEETLQKEQARSLIDNFLFCFVLFVLARKLIPFSPPVSLWFPVVFIVAVSVPNGLFALQR